jgi:hypothetical protein
MCLERGGWMWRWCASIGPHADATASLHAVAPNAGGKTESLSRCGPRVLREGRIISPTIDGLQSKSCRSLDIYVQTNVRSDQTATRRGEHMKPEQAR